MQYFSKPLICSRALFISKKRPWYMGLVGPIRSSCRKSWHSRPEIAFLRRSCLRGWSLQASDIWILGGFLPLLGQNGPYASTVQTKSFVLNTCFASGSLEWGNVPMWLVPNENPWVVSLWWASVVDNISHVLSLLIAGGIKCILCDLLEACAWFPTDVTPRGFSHCWFCSVSTCRDTS